MKVIYTKHALERMAKRDLSRLSVEQTIKKPDKIWAEKSEKRKFVAWQGKRQYQVIAKWQEKEQAWLVVSAWVRGEEDQAPLMWRMLAWLFKKLWQLIKLLFGWD